MTFLTEFEVDQLTGIGKGKNGKSKNELQAEWLTKMGFPVIVNARGRPILAKSFIDGTAKAAKNTKTWQPNLT